jgi:hypothetical protein
VRIPLLMLIVTTGLIASTTAEAVTPAATAVSSPEPGESGQSAVWTARKLLSFSPTMEDSTGVSCDELVGQTRDLLLRLGARASDLIVDGRRCYGIPGLGVDVSFSVLVPIDGTGKNAARASVSARWQLFEGRAESPWDCAYLDYVTKKVLPLFSTRNAKRISREVCKTHDVGLRTELLKPTQQLAYAR